MENKIILTLIKDGIKGNENSDGILPNAQRSLNDKFCFLVQMPVYFTLSSGGFNEHSELAQMVRVSAILTNNFHLMFSANLS